MKKSTKFIVCIVLILAIIIAASVIITMVVVAMRKPTLGVVCTGGLGNLLFQFAFIYSLARDNDCNFTMRGLDDYSNVHTDNVYIQLKKDIVDLPNYKPTMKVENEVDELKEFRHDDYNTYCNKNTLFSGYFQSEKYFKKYRKDILKILKEPDVVTKVLDETDIDFDTGMFLHVRTGDYEDFNWILPKSYYDKCLAQVPDRVENVYVFSNNIDDAKKIIADAGDFKVHFIEYLDELETLYSMARMKYGGICANSTFSWWGAWLNTSDCKTIFMPKDWLPGKDCDDVHIEHSITI